MLLDDIGQKILTTLRDSAAILAKCNTLFTSPHSVFYATTGSEAPPHSEMPFFLILPERRQKSQSGADKTFDFLLGLQVNDPTITTATSVSGVTTHVCRGSKTVEELLDLAWLAITAATPQVTWVQADLDIDATEFFPVCTGVLVLSASIPTVMGGFEVTL